MSLQVRSSFSTLIQLLLEWIDRVSDSVADHLSVVGFSVFLFADNDIRLIWATSRVGASRGGQVCLCASLSNVTISDCRITIMLLIGN